MRYVFGDYVLDTERAELQSAGGPIQLRRKAFQVLVYLLAHRDRVVPTQELLEHLWPDQFVGDEVLKACIKAVRQALGERGRAPRFVRTLHGQGYRFVALVEVREPLPADVTAPPSVSPPSAGRRIVPPVGRAQELTRLHAWLTQARRGGRQMVFVTGEAGLGKTTLVEAFVAALGTNGPLWIGHGQCVEHYGVGEAYLPVLEALGRLCRGPGGQELVALLGQQAPTWLVQMPGLLRAADLEPLRRRMAGATRERMLRELAEALELLTAQQPLVLVLEDLHWSDPSTLDLLAILARRREPARLLLIATYRPPEVRRRAHPLHSIQQELQLHGHGVELPLTLLTEEAIATYLACRLPGLPRVDRLARLVHQRTEGNPLFMVTLVDSWLTQGVLREQDGVWALAATVEALHNSVPDSLRQMIDRQLDGLSAEEQRVLEAASVAGVEFSAAGVAAGLAQEVEHVDDWCTALARRGQFLRTSGEQIWPDGTVAGCLSLCPCPVSAGALSAGLGRAAGAAAPAHWGTTGGGSWRPGRRHGGRAGHALCAWAGRPPRRAVSPAGRPAQYGAFGVCGSGGTPHQGVSRCSRPCPPRRSAPSKNSPCTLPSARHCTMTKGNAAPEVEHAYTQAHALCQQVGETPQLGHGPVWSVAVLYDTGTVAHGARAWGNPAAPGATCP